MYSENSRAFTEKDAIQAVSLNYCLFEYYSLNPYIILDVIALNLKTDFFRYSLHITEISVKITKF